jgi:hypothetical protein
MIRVKRFFKWIFVGGVDEVFLGVLIQISHVEGGRVE